MGQARESVGVANFVKIGRPLSPPPPDWLRNERQLYVNGRQGLAALLQWPSQPLPRLLPPLLPLIISILMSHSTTLLNLQLEWKRHR